MLDVLKKLFYHSLSLADGCLHNGSLANRVSYLQYLFIFNPHTQSDRFLLRYENSTVGNLAAIQPIQRLLDTLLRQGERLDNRLDLV